MDTHGSETFFVEGEGLLSESSGGRNDRITAASVPPFRFSRMGPKGVNRQLSDSLREKLADAMAVGGGGDGQIPAGFTYLGQFIDHDLTADRTNVMIGANVTPAQLLQGRSPSLDLDSLYGAGPGDPASAMFYEADGTHLKTGKTKAEGGIGAKEGFDLPRGAGSSAAQKRKAIIPDARNDENLAVAQTHAAMIRFHNRVVDTLPAAVPPSQRFAKARELVTKHYQWMIETDYLPRVCAPGVVNDVFNNGRKAFEVGVSPTKMPTMPIEFSVAGFRLGHSMIRDSYNWNKVFDNGAGSLGLLFTFSATSGNLGGNPRLISTWIADFRRLYDFGEANRHNLEVASGKFNHAMHIDTKIADPLKHLRPASFGGPSMPARDPRRNLAFRNLTRAKMLQLATGQQMARFLKHKGVTLTELSKAQIRDGSGGGIQLDHLTQAQRGKVLKDTPLWFYVLREAEFNAGRLKGVGARIVAETLQRAIQGSQNSIVRDTAFKPRFGPNNHTFRMVDLLLFAFEGKKSLLAPLG